jgi:hypothetical protein
MQILVKDNYFKEPDLLREIALSINTYRVDNELRYSPMGWRGQRSRPLRELNNKKLNKLDKDVFKLCYKSFDLDNFIYKISPPQYQKPETEFTITSYFHITTEKTRGAYYDFCDRFHKDSDVAVAGVMYLNHNPPPNSGTSILDGEKNQFINVENAYNRLVCYEGYRVHSLSDVFGTCNETGRLTYTFFIHETQFSDTFDS